MQTKSNIELTSQWKHPMVEIPTDLSRTIQLVEDRWKRKITNNQNETTVRPMDVYVRTLVC